MIEDWGIVVDENLVNGDIRDMSGDEILVLNEGREVFGDEVLIGGDGELVSGDRWKVLDDKCFVFRGEKLISGYGC